ncbi:uncharacterized protein LTR77_009248 [Saxophila tyrrhenica]|uniref:Uncharacterized protein n=1 Tax=Saxophila tyrrhenica TaxID=1690608 RepID=A0AAV9P2E4_9PEZI|nr:hypothetical protein LTR77_009248 [Saxophila tyrrhenica]
MAFRGTQDGPPYEPRYQTLGAIPAVVPDVPIDVVFLVLFLVIGIGHGVVFYWNLVGSKRKFLVNAMVAAWACVTSNTHLAIAASIFLYAGVVLLYLANLFFAQRILRAQHPTFGWRKPVSIAFTATFAITGAVVICLIAAVITSSYTDNLDSLDAAIQLQRLGATMLAIIATLPLFIVGASSLARRHPHILSTKTCDKFGSGSMRTKIIIVMATSIFLALGAWFRAGVVLSKPVPASAPQPGYLSKPAFYIFLFTFEFGICLFWLLVRVDNRFFTPDGAHGPFSYAGGFVFAGEAGNEKRHSAHRNFSRPTSTISKPTSSRPTSSVHSPPISPLSRRSSFAGSLSSRASQKQMKLAHLEQRVSWGGISREDVRDHLDEEGKVLRYQAFAGSWTGGDTAADTGVEGMEKEMGFDPESGLWAVRPISGVRGEGVEIGELGEQSEGR